ncbi:MAG TPA: hypothetical protein PLM16_00265, partial [Candidatus Woesebacteria bacterium]|nr:hypothetical protein [Candidatus Woesebacteria bacterium]
MGLPNVFSKKKSQSNDLFITLLITSNSVSSVLWRAQGQKISILNQSKARPYQNNDDQLVQCDESLQDLGKESEATDQVLFALEPDWASQTEINPDKDARLQELCEDLSLKAVGFVLITEAFNSHLLQENPLLSSLVLYVGASSLYLEVMLQGKITTALAVGRSDNLIQDVTEALARLNQEVTSLGARLPLIINLASASVTQPEIDQYQQQLFALNWVEEFGFAQTPLIETTSVDDLVELVVRHGGLAVAQDLGLIEMDQSTDKMDKQSTESGVILDQDEVANLPKTALLNQEGQSNSKLPTSFGIPISSNHQGDSSRDESLANATLLATDIKDTRPQKSTSRLLSWFSKKKNHTLFKQPKSSAQDVTKNIARSARHSPKKVKTIIVGGVILGVLVSGVSLYLLLSRSYQAVVTIKPDVQLLDKEVTITLDTDIDQSVPADGLLKAQEIYQEVTEKKTAPTTGVKLVGEKAQGQVKIINKTESEKTFSQDTVFYSGSLEFSLDEEVTVPAATVELNSSGDGEKKNYGQKEAKLTAREIGTDSNIGKDQELKIDSFGEDTYSAKTVS